MPTTRLIPLTLGDLRPGERGRVLECSGDGAIGQRLLEMGLVEGTAVRLVRVAPFGDPLQIEVGDYHLSLRRAEAARIRVTREP